VTSEKEILNQGIEQLGLKISPSNTEKLIAYMHLLIKWNKASNLIAASTAKTIITEHILDSLSIARFLKGQRIIDVGTGAGLPGIPLALACPDKSFTLLDSRGKKTRFLVQAVAELDLKNIEVEQTRIEDYFPTPCFDSVVTRAFSTLRKNMALTDHILCKDGMWLAMKGTLPQDEIDEIDEISGDIVTHKLDVPGLNKHRHLICIQRQTHG